ncbi:Hypothetical protein FKW44_001104, partial [Caligus rogercresseyi]
PRVKQDLEPKKTNFVGMGFAWCPRKCSKETPVKKELFVTQLIGVNETMGLKIPDRQGKVICSTRTLGRHVAQVVKTTKGCDSRAC